MANAAYLRFGAAILAVAAAAVGVVVAVDLIRVGARPDRRVREQQRGRWGSRRDDTGDGDRRRPHPDPRQPRLSRAAAGRRRPRPRGRIACARRRDRPRLAPVAAPRLRPRRRGRRRGRPEGHAPASAVPGRWSCRRAAGAATRRSSRCPAHRGRSPSRLTALRYRFALPALRPAPPDGTGIVDEAATTWRGLKSLVWRERLAGSPTAVIHSVFRAVAPDRLSYAIDGGSSAVIIGGTRWDRRVVDGTVGAIAAEPAREPADAVLGSGRGRARRRHDRRRRPQSLGGVVLRPDDPGLVHGHDRRAEPPDAEAAR